MLPEMFDDTQFSIGEITELIYKVLNGDEE